MESIKNLKSIIEVLLLTCFLVTLSTAIYAQETKKELNNFNITIEKKDNKIIMKCDEGCT